MKFQSNDVNNMPDEKKKLYIEIINLFHIEKMIFFFSSFLSSFLSKDQKKTKPHITNTFTYNSQIDLPLPHLLTLFVHRFTTLFS